MEVCDEKITTTSNSSTQDIFCLKNVIFTLHDGKLLVTPKELHGPSNVRCRTKTPCVVGLEEVCSQSDEIHIEIIRENAVQSDQTDQKEFGENTISNISSAYEAFWKYDFQKCIERRTCVKCGQVLLTPRCLFHHWQHVHENLQPSECFVCHKLFSNEEESNEHILKIHCIVQPECTCEVCMKVFINESDKNIHRALHPKNISCKWCQDCFPCEFLLTIHLRGCLHYKANLDCHICGCHYRSSHMLQLHRLRHSRVICDICQSSFLSESNVRTEEIEIELIRHLKTCHSLDEVNSLLSSLKKQDEEEKTLDKLFMNHEPIAKILDSKLSQQLPQINLQSSLTEIENLSDPLDQHVILSKCSTKEPIQDQIIENINLPETALQCTGCLKTFDSKEELLTHDLEHQMPFCCNVCEEKFPHRRRYKKHMRSHGILVKPGAIRYKCKQCSVCCGTMSGLRTHLLTHTNQKPHLCDRCGLRFRRAQALRVHENTVHCTRALHTCSLCGSGSLSKPSLLRHIQCVHGGVRRFICGLCGTRFLQNQDLRKHLKRIHDSNYPPMERVSKKSNKEIHVIPPIKDINPTNPLASVLKSAIKEEQSKLEALCQRSGKIHLEKGTDQTSIPENYTDGILLNILGDVASKAAPLERNNAPENLKPIINQGLQTDTKFLCAGCQYVSDTLNDFSTHLAQCHQEKCIGITEKKNLNPLPPPKAAGYLSTGSSLLNSAVSLAQPFCVISSQDTGSTFQIGPSVISSCDNNYLCSVMNLGAIVPQAQTVTFPLAIGSVFCSNTVINESCVVTSEQTLLDNEPVKSLASKTVLDNQSVKSLVNIIHEESFNSSQLDLPNGVHSHSVSSQVVSISQRDIEPCLLKDASNLDMSITNASLNNACGNLNQSNCDSQTITAVFDASLENPSSEFVIDEQHLQGQESYSKIMIVPTDQEILLPNSSVHSRKINAMEASSTGIAECALVPELSSKPSKKCLPAQTSKKVDFWIHNVEAETSPANMPSGSIGLSTHSIGSKCDNASVSRRDVASLQTMEIGQNVCPECGAKLSCASNFKRHLQGHFGQKAHECLYCGKSFRYKCNLTVHIRSHTGARPYECPECKKKFRYQTEFKEHKQSHESSRSLSCKECGQSFIRQRDLRRHFLSHSNKKRPTCYVCQKPFSRLDYLKVHMRSHQKQEEISNEGLEELKRDEGNGSQKYSCKKTRHQKESSFGCSFCSISFASTNERKTHQELCKENVQEVTDCLPNHNKLDRHPGRNTIVLPDVIESNTSEDLISLAYQAAEDGVEFMFVEENSFAVNNIETDVEDQNMESNVLYV